MGVSMRMNGNVHLMAKELKLCCLMLIAIHSLFLFFGSSRRCLSRLDKRTSHSCLITSDELRHIISLIIIITTGGFAYSIISIASGNYIKPTLKINIAVVIN